ncbi:hypothetical protein PWY87_19545 [Kribbella solani]|uniref:hypothetical protein n=1 Tax=Kribbella solani TaxID=236067 RepID=UPI0029A71C64|nr:hypothetical protein [Kribbella solani]MDX3003893.1 hypothetical protein [Kribbella solani]
MNPTPTTSPATEHPASAALTATTRPAWTALAVVARPVGAALLAVSCCLAAGCSSDEAVHPPSTSPNAIPTTPAGNPLKLSDLPHDPQVIWREDLDYDRTATNEDVTLVPGSYEIRAVCSAPAALKISANGGAPQDLTCSTAYAPGLKICTTKPGLTLTLRRTSDPQVDLVWQLGRTTPTNCPTTPPTTTPTGPARG